MELKYLSDERFAQDYTRLRKENQGSGGGGWRRTWREGGGEGAGGGDAGGGV